MLDTKLQRSQETRLFNYLVKHGRTNLDNLAHFPPRGMSSASVFATVYRLQQQGRVRLDGRELETT